MRFGYLVVGVVGLWVLTPVFVLNLLPAGESANWAIRGQFGDLFGAVNSLFSGLAFAGLFWALRLQADQLEMQRTELAQFLSEGPARQDPTCCGDGRCCSEPPKVSGSHADGPRTLGSSNQDTPDESCR